ncbi:transposase [Rubricoccus marinus]|uniref:Transposase IS200-like domain-containing protein n=1 Tax=Rubricoccus marinus TaxID=716817 RepID=A0A259TUQ0_9BACT|nr:transposase [Rubricoccus marinus]OZC01485.1 hypothetical protein BSZ36_17580 [Rubricoccus marinus]
MPSTDPSLSGDRVPDPARPDYGTDGQAVYWLRYYVLIVTRRRRPFFQDERARRRCEELMTEIAGQIGCEVVRCQVSPAQVIVEVMAPPKMAPHSIAHRLRYDAAAPLKAEFEEIARVGAAFAHQYMVTTVPVPETDCNDFEARISRS